MKKSLSITLNKRTVPAFVTDLSNEQLELAANELEKLLFARFGEVEPEKGVPVRVRFDVRESAAGFSVKTQAGTLVFTAPSATEILYAVYDFAEAYLGFTFFEPGVDTLTDESPKVTLPADAALIRSRKPVMKYRGLIQEFPFTEENYVIADWMVKNKLNYLQTWMKYYDECDDDLKDFMRIRGITVESGHHNFSYLIPAEKYAKKHPEFFAEIGGKRIKPSSCKSELLMSEQLCTTNPALREELVKNLIAYAKAHPEITRVGLNPNDGFGWCECKECSKYYDKSKKGELYSLSEHVYLAGGIYHALLGYVNRRLREEGCDLTVCFGAYVNYCAPSKGMKLEPGMCVWMAPYWRCINHLIDDKNCPVNSRYAQDIAAWCKVKCGGEVMIYEYLMGVNFYLSLPMIHMAQIFDETKFYVQTGVDGYMTQFHLGHWNVYGVNYYCMAKALYGYSKTATIAKLMNALFGKDAAEGRRFYAKMRRLQLSAGVCHIPYPYSLFSRTQSKQYETLLDAAKSLCRKLPQDDFRKDLVLWCEYILRFKKFFDAYHAGKAGVKEAKAFRKWTHERCDGRLVVKTDRLDMYFDEIEKMLAQGKEWIHFGIDWEDAYVKKHHETILS